MVDYLEVQFDSEEKPERFCGDQEGEFERINYTTKIPPQQALFVIIDTPLMSFL